MVVLVFQLTRPMWGVTPVCGRRWSFHEFQLTRPMWGVTSIQGRDLRETPISTHTPHVGRDAKIFGTLQPGIGFQLTRPMWGVTVKVSLPHSPHNHFNSHAPCGA